MSVAFIFDVDGVLCDRGQPIDDKFLTFFKNWVKNRTVYFVTGSERQKTLEQLNPEVLDAADIAFHCLGNVVFINGKEVYVNQFSLSEEEESYIKSLIDQSTYPFKTEYHIEQRKGSVNFSVIGKDASQQLRHDYARYDEKYNERISIIKKFTKKFPKYEAFIGGEVSIDVCLRGANKGQVIKLISHEEKTYYFGDRCGPYGIDSPLRQYFAEDNPVYTLYQIDHGYKQTWEILKKL